MAAFDTLRFWLRSEALEEGSEKGLTALLRSLPDLRPSSALVDAVMSELGLAPLRHRATSWWARGAILACLVLGSSSFLLIPVARLVPLPHLSDFVGLAVAIVQLGAAWWTAALSLWGLVFSLGDKVSLIFSAPEAMLGLVLTSTVGLVAFRWLLSLTHQQRSSGYAASI